MSGAARAFHRLSDVNPALRIASCSLCGPAAQIRVSQRKPDGTVTWRCRTPILRYQKGRDWSDVIEQRRMKRRLGTDFARYKDRRRRAMYVALGLTSSWLAKVSVEDVTRAVPSLADDLEAAQDVVKALNRIATELRRRADGYRQRAGVAA